MGTFSRLRYVVAANVNALLEKAEDPEKLLRALIREMEDASEEARLASADLLAEQQRLARLESDLEAESGQWRDRAENAVVQDRDDLARVALKARAEVDARHKAVVEEQSRLAERITQMEQDMLTLKSKLAEAKARLKSMHMEAPNGGKAATVEHSTPGERKMRRAMQRVRSYEVGGAAPAVWQDQPAEQADPAIEAELQRLKQRLAAGEQRPAESEEA
jgi:phage shock protein A